MNVTRSRPRPLRQQRRRAMGSDAHVLVVTDPDADPADAAAFLAGAGAHIDVLEGRWSRFRPDSEISALNRHSGAPVVVSSDTYRARSRLPLPRGS